MTCRQTAGIGICRPGRRGEGQEGCGCGDCCRAAADGRTAQGPCHSMSPLLLASELCLGISEEAGPEQVQYWFPTPNGRSLPVLHIMQPCIDLKFYRSCHDSTYQMQRTQQIRGNPALGGCRACHVGYTAHGMTESSCPYKSAVWSMMACVITG